MSDRKQHARRRRDFTNMFPMSMITGYEPVIAKQVKTCMDFIASEGCKGQVRDLYNWWHYLCMDIKCDLSFGSTFNMVQYGASNA